ncbi:TetR/AcrR family transcriptional regulator [Promicromonospora umidemergens]|uniref:TetR/AcrR family transcriptional regulator n=1 Tax=Promicromonospora umidemergens TaxID=629679 RepID=A0ABP8X8Q1_9MICO|nr:TetR/AcrR family transcriptional regulator [Promicromonospora umidemergens]
MANSEAGSRGRSYRKGPERRAQILLRAMELFAERGVGASLRAIGEAIGVSHAALRYYFANRDELLVEVYRAHESQVHEAQAREGSAPEEVSAVAMMEMSAERNRSIPGLVELYATLTTDALQERQHPETREFVQARYRRVRADLAERVRAGQRSGAIAADVDPEDAAALVVAASDGLQLQWLLASDTVDVRRSLELLERLLPGAGRAEAAGVEAAGQAGSRPAEA